jgi:hypothetical protein
MNEDAPCPACGKKMERGYLTSKMGTYWDKKPPRFFAAGESLTVDTYPVFKFHYIRSLRCKECKILRYFEDSGLWED